MKRFIFSSLVLAAVMFTGIPQAEAQSRPNRSQFSPGVFQKRLNQISQFRRGQAAVNSIMANYATFARINPSLAFTYLRLAMIRLNRFSTPEQRPAIAVRLADMSAAALSANGVNSQGLIVSTFTYIVQSIPTDARTQDVLVSIAEAAVSANVDTGGTPAETVEILNAIGVSAVTPVPVS